MPPTPPCLTVPHKVFRCVLALEKTLHFAACQGTELCRWASSERDRSHVQSRDCPPAGDTAATSQEQELTVHTERVLNWSLQQILW